MHNYWDLVRANIPNYEEKINWNIVKLRISAIDT